MFDTLLALTLVATAFAIALAALVSFTVLDQRRGRKHRLLRPGVDRDRAVVFLFEDEALIDATPEARQIMASGPRKGSEWAHLSTLLLPRFPALKAWISDLADQGEMALTSADGTSRIDAEWRDGVARLTLVDVETSEPQVGLDRHSLSAMRYELETLRATADHAPQPIWREDAAGTVTWANRAYLDLAETLNAGQTIQPWPPARIFGDRADGNATALATSQRRALTLPDGDAKLWFDLTATDLNGQVLFSAMPADRIVRAETALSEFIATLTKTFAHLPIGLAIFDRKRQLALFNPALNDLTALPASFLCANPTLFAFLDRMREKRMMPEPKDYKSWRQQMSELEAGAVDGTYEETWALPTGQTYRVTGRPHPDGAVAFLFEDISAEISLTRRFRAELEMGQSALDCMAEAVAVFSPGGVLAMSNAAYADLWGIDPSTSLGDMNVSDATRTWHRNCAPTPVWRDLRAFVADAGERAEWTASVNLKDGRSLACRFAPMARGATLAAFRITNREIQASSEPALPLERAKA